MVADWPLPYNKPLRRHVEVRSRPGKSAASAKLPTATSLPALTDSGPSEQSVTVVATNSGNGSAVAATQSHMDQLRLVRLSISGLIKKYFSYPAIARWRNWQGKVVVEVRVAATGRLSDIQVVESSGFRVLDSAATRTVSRLERLPKKIAMGIQGPVHVRLPIIYRLEG